MLSTKGEGPSRGLLPDYEPSNRPSFQALVSSNNWFTNSRSSSYYSKEEKSVHTMVITGTQSSPCEFLSAFIVWPLMVSTEAGHLGHTHCSWIKVRWRMNESDLLICFWLSPILLCCLPIYLICHTTWSSWCMQQAACAVQGNNSILFSYLQCFPILTSTLIYTTFRKEAYYCRLCAKSVY